MSQVFKIANGCARRRWHLSSPRHLLASGGELAAVSLCMTRSVAAARVARSGAERTGRWDVSEVYRPGAESCGPGTGRGPDAQPQLHRH